MTNSFVENIEEHGVFSDESFGKLSERKIPPGDTDSPIPIWIRLRKTIFSNGEKINSRFQTSYFVLSRGAKTGVMQRIMRIFGTKNKCKRTGLNREVILSTLLSYCCQFYRHIRMYSYGKQWANRNENPKRLIPVKMTCEASVWLRTQNKSSAS